MKTKLAMLIILVAATSTCSAVDVATEHTVSRIDYDLPALQKPAGRDSFAFRIFIRHALSYSAYALDGALTVPEVGEAGGAVTLVERGEAKGRTFALTHSQAHEIYGWFSDAKFFDPKTDEILQVPVLDGDEILVEGFIGGRYFRFGRNSGDSAVSAAFFRRVEVFRIWKEEPNTERSVPR